MSPDVLRPQLPAADAARPQLPTAVVGVVIALCALLLVKWLAVIGLVALGLVVLARVMWLRRYRPLSTLGSVPVFPLPRIALEPVPSADDCSWCGLRGGHRDPSGQLLRPRLVHRV